MPPDMAISMRHTKLKAEEAALLAGEISKPSWESKNEGIHERVSFEDSIWGFDLAGGVFYKTPLRVTYVKPEGRAAKAGIRPGDKLLRINDIDTSTLTIQQAHDIIIESGIHLKLSVTAPEDEESSYYCYEDPLMDGYDSEEERRLLEEEKAKKRRVCARVSHFWSLQWPWVSKRRLIYRESNCFMVPSKYEDERRDKYPPQPVLRYTDDSVHYSKDQKQEENQETKKRVPSLTEVKEKARKSKQEANGDAGNDVASVTNEPVSHMTNVAEPVTGDAQQKSTRTTLNVERQESMEGKKEGPLDNKEVPRDEEELNEEINKTFKVDTAETNEVDDALVKEVHENSKKVSSDLSPIPEIVDDSNIETEDGEAKVDNVTENDEVEIVNDDANDNVEMLNGDVNDDDVINEVLGKTSDSAPRGDEDNILDSILSDEGQNLENAESNNER